MAPGVAKSFAKNIFKVIDIKYTEACIDSDEVETSDGSKKLTNIGIKHKIQEYVKQHRLVMNKSGYKFIKDLFKNEYMLSISDNDIDAIIKKAKEITNDDTHQAMEAVVHNLNSMHCLPASERIWVYDTFDNSFRTWSMEELTDKFEANRFKVVSLNKKSGKAEFKFVTAAKRMDNNRDIVEIHSNQGATVRVTDNHRVMTISGKEITEDYPNNITRVIAPRHIKTPMVNNDICLESYGKIRRDTPYQESHVFVTEEFAEFMGYYMADGSLLGDSGTLCMTTCGKVPFEEMRKLAEYAFGTSFISSVTYYENSKVGTSEKDIRFSVGRRLARMISDKFGRVGAEKHVPIEIMFATDNIKVAFLKAFFRCDGRSAKNYAEAWSSNRVLRDQMAFMIHSLGGSVHYNSRLHKTDISKHGEIEMHSISLSSTDSVYTGIKESTGAKFEIPKYDLTMVPNVLSNRSSGNTRYIELEEMLDNGINTECAHLMNIFINTVLERNHFNSGDEYVYDISVEDNENFLTEQCIYVHNSRAGAQVPFSSINFGTDISEEGRMASFNLLKATDEGLGNGETPIFPISIFKMKAGVSFNPGDPNYDLFQESIRVSAKRLFPNFSNLDAPYNAAYYKPGDVNTEVSYMGCVQGCEVITYRINGTLYVEGIGRAWERMKAYGVKNTDVSSYVDLTLNGANVEVWDSNSKAFVKVKTFIKNPNRHNWKQLTLTNGRSLTATSDHPLPVHGRGRIPLASVNIGDKISVTYKQYTDNRAIPSFSTEVAWMLGMMICSSSYVSNVRINVPYRENKIIDRLIKAANEVGFEASSVDQDRGAKGRYSEVNIKCGNGLKSFRAKLQNLFGGRRRIDRHIPSEVFTWQYEYRKAFMLGMMDASAVVNDRDAKTCVLGIENKEFAIQQAALLQTLGVKARYYEKEMSKEYGVSRALIEFNPIHDLAYSMTPSTRANDIQSIAISSSPVSEEVAVVQAIRDTIVYEDSYDIETSSDRFDVSGIYSHNCRTRVIGNVYDPSREIVTGRGNLSFTSINLPRLGIKSNGNITRFFELLDEMLELVHKQLISRFEVQCRKHPRNYPFLMGQGVWIDTDKLGPDDDITDALKHGTLTVGFIGLAECLVALTGKHHGESEESQKLGLSIIGHMRETTDKWSQNEKLNYSVIATPAEGLSNRFTRIDKKKFGIIPGVTDREYYTNSMHVPVYYPISAFKKIKIEAPYHALCNAGHISYIELDGDPSKNLKAFEKVIRCMHDEGIGYGAINHPVDLDPVCNYVGIIDDVCPRCGRREGEPMTEEMWQKIKGYPSWANADYCGTCGNQAEEADRIPNLLDDIKDIDI